MPSTSFFTATFILASVFSLAGCGSSADAKPAAPTVAVGGTATLNGTLPPLVGQVTVTVDQHPATITGTTWTATMPLTERTGSAAVVVLLEGQIVAKRVITVEW